MGIDIELAAFFVGIYNKNKKDLDFLIDSAAPKDVMLRTYKDFVNNKLFLPIELLNKNEKEELVSKCRATGLKFSNRTLTEAASILYTINFINDNS